MAMLMNLSLRTNGKQKMEQIHTVMIPLLKGILMSGSGQIIIYAIGILFSIITNLTMKEFIKEANLKEILNKMRDDIRNTLFVGIQNEEDDMTEDEKRQLLVQISYIVQKIDETDTQDIIKEAENSRIGFSHTEEQENESEENIIIENSRPGTTQRGAIEDDEELTDDEELDSTLQEANVLIGDALLLAEYVQTDVRDQSISISGSPRLMNRKSPQEESKMTSTPRIKDQPVVFDYERPSLKRKVSNESTKAVYRYDNKIDETMKSSRGFNVFRNEQFKRQYQSVDHEILNQKDDDYSLIFKNRSKLIRTPTHPGEAIRDEYEKQTFRKINKTSRASKNKRSDDVRSSYAPKSKQKSLF